MAEARPEEDEENMRREAGEQVVRRQSDGRPGRRKPENRLSQGPLWALRAAIKRSTSRSSFSDQPRDRNRDGNARRPEITVLSAEPLPSPSWLAGTPGTFPPPPPPAAQIWGPTIPPDVQPPPSYEDVIREKTQEQEVHSSSPAPSPSTSSSHPAKRTTIATQTDTGSSSGAQAERLKPQRPPIPAAPSQANGEVASPLTPGPESEQLAPSPCANEAQRPRPRPRPRSSLATTPVSNEVKVQTLVKLREDGLATLAALARSDATKQDASGGKYLQELLEAFSSDDWGFPEQQGDDSGHSLSEEEEEEDMATLRARIQAFEKQQVALDGSGGDADMTEDVVAKRPEPRPRPRLQVQPAKMQPPVLAPKPKSLSKSASADETSPEIPKPKPPPVTEPLSTHLPPTAPCPAPVPAPRLPPVKTTPDENTTKFLSRPTVAPRTSVGTPPHEKAPSARHVTPMRPPRPSMKVSRRPPPHSQDTIDLTGPSLELNAVPFKTPALGPAPVQTKVISTGFKKAESLCEPPLPPRPSNVKHLPPRPPPIKSVPARPPPPASASPVNRPLTPSSLTGVNHRASKRGPPLPPRPKPGHPLFRDNMQEVLIVLDELPPEPLTTSVTGLSSECLLDLDVFPPAQLPEPVVEVYQQKQTELPPLSIPRHVALYDFEGAQDDELTFAQGDAISLLEVVDQQWGRGQIGGRVGLFPMSFTQLAEDRPLEISVVLTPSKEMEVEEWALALFDFAGQTAEDLSFHKGAHIQVIEHVDSEWRRGRLAGKEGLYPVAFTQPCQAPPIASSKAAVKGVAKALFAFTAENEDELTVKPGDIITQVESSDEQWIVGVVGGKRGMVPKNYILLL
ncbi:SH3 domain-containing protein 19-like isoform X2 [Corythoichthys intestinalis]|uniref:SH3 domain-containing protein 19-like isoform X2 n=1 Tax=Corythoichthys intestinalis TaxID=161448 RepID=UPI0025A5DD6C|nr:SH3 domain-containing protein 19-like isoform X2 [Corythoichthys intestinalis]